VHGRHKRYFYQLLARYIAFYLPASGRIVEVKPPSAYLREALESRHIAVEAVNDIETSGERSPERIILAGCVHFVPDIQQLLERVHGVCAPHTRVILTYYSTLWKPVFTLAARLGLANTGPSHNWVAPTDIQNLLALSAFELVASTPRVLIPIYIPFVSNVVNRWIAPLPFFRIFALAHVAIARPRARTAHAARAPSVSVVIPARNERGNIEAAVKRLPAMGPDDEVIFVEGHSSDGTLAEMKRVATAFPGKRIRVLQQTGKGKGDAVRLGFQEAERDILMILDADLTVPPEELPKFYRAIVDDVGEFINGSRLVYPMEDRAMRFANMIGNKFFAAAFSFLLGQPLKDTLCGTKVLSRAQYAAIAQNRAYFGEFDPFGDFDLLFGAARQGLKIAELPIRYRERVYGETNIRRWVHGLLLLRMTAFAARRLRFL
jgi:hypothetical protein